MFSNTRLHSFSNVSAYCQELNFGQSVSQCGFFGLQPAAGLTVNPTSILNTKASPPYFSKPPLFDFYTAHSKLLLEETRYQSRGDRLSFVAPVNHLLDNKICGIVLKLPQGSSCGLRLIYESDVVDLIDFIQMPLYDM